MTEGGPVPDHGDFWQLPWKVTWTGANQLTLEADGFSRPLHFRKVVCLREDTLQTTYYIRNVGDMPQSFLYACHPLFAVSPGDRIWLPDDVHALRLDYSRHNRLGERGDLVPWPRTKVDASLDLVRPPDVGTADMFYTGRLGCGSCGIQRLSTGQTLQVNFPVDRLPYLGVWLCYGGWPDDAADNPQYAVALEPTTAPWNSLTEAQAADAAISLAPGEAYEFEISFRVIGR